jgi:hydrogenase maturation protein HypF
LRVNELGSENEDRTAVSSSILDSQSSILVLPSWRRLRLVVRGAVQGVGFRPFVYRLATELHLSGWVSNSAQGVLIEIEGKPRQLDIFLQRLRQDKPPQAFIQDIESSDFEPAGDSTFSIRTSDRDGDRTALVLPDLATCEDCMREIFDLGNRRYRYPFTNCTHCGPRFSIIEALPYDRPRTTMKAFTMCSACRAEYENPDDRRFHAQPNACPRCGPHLELWDSDTKVLATHDEALIRATDLIRNGTIVAIKGLGGFHLFADARNEKAVRSLRRLKGREAKPFAVMCRDRDTVRKHCNVSALEGALLCSPASPIVLLQRLANAKESLAQAIAPGNPNLGVLLPYTPLHHLLMAELDFPVVATSGNLSEEPICTDEREAVCRLTGIAHAFLVHNRPIARHVDDSVVRVLLGREQLLRRARGYAPLPISIGRSLPSILAVGGHLKNAVAVSLGKNIFISQHIGDLQTQQAHNAFLEVAEALCRMYDFRPATVACDLHLDYSSTHFAKQTGLPVVGVQHHYAHVLACMADNHLDGPMLGVCWDGTGYGQDETVWGGEFLEITESSFERVAHLRTFSLPGGEIAIREPRRTALGLLYELFGDALFSMNRLALLNAFSVGELGILRTMLRRQINTPRTSSIGRFFDAIAALVGFHPFSQFEGQAAMVLEFALDGIQTMERYDLELTERRHEKETNRQEDKKMQVLTPLVLDWARLVGEVLEDIDCGRDRRLIAAKFHNALVEAIVAVARRLGEERVLLTGGCFQNKYLTEQAVRRLRFENFQPYCHWQVPPNDGGIAVGQIVAAARQIAGNHDYVSSSTRKAVIDPGR